MQKKIQAPNFKKQTNYKHQIQNSKRLVFEIWNLGFRICNFKKNKSGFTLVELLISLAIFGVISAALVANLRSGNNNESVRLAARQAEGLLRRAQTMTIAGEVVSGGNFPAGGYGVRFGADGETLTLFADADGNYAYNSGEELLEGGESFPQNAVFSLGGALDVVFSPPDGDVYFDGLAAPDAKTITFSASDSVVTKGLVIYRLSGQIRVE